MHLETLDGDVHIIGHCFHYIYNPYTAGWKSICAHQQEWLQAPCEWTIWRAPIDNDRKIKRIWQEAGYDRIVVKHYETNYNNESEAVKITTTFALTAVFLQRIAVCSVTWTIQHTGEILCHIHVDKDPDFPDLPRFGIVFPLKKEVQECTYLGYGPFESYRDKHYADYFGIFTTDVQKNFEPYSKPQENGSHYATCYVTLKCYQNVIGFYLPQQNSFNLSPYSIQEISNAAHVHELGDSSATYIHLDYVQNGIGSNSCGPELATADRFLQASFDWDFQIHPLLKTNTNKECTS